MCTNLANHTVDSLLYNTDYALPKELFSYPVVYQHLQFHEGIKFRENDLMLASKYHTARKAFYHVTSPNKALCCITVSAGGSFYV